MKLKLTPRNIPARESGVTVGVTPRQARWRFVRFAVHQLAIRSRWRSAAKGEEICLVLLEGFCHVECDGQTHTLGPRGDVFSGYPHAIYLPPGTAFTVIAGARTLIAECAAPTKKRFPLRVITPEDCGFEIRGGGLVPGRDGSPPFAPPHGYHPSSRTAPGPPRRSMAASDDPRYAQFRAR